MKLACAAACALLALASAGCSDDPQLVIVIEHPTLIEVSPAEFLGPVPCLPAAGAMRRYVATVFDVTPATTEDGSGGAAPEGEAENFALPSSGPTPCTQPIATAFVLEGRRYAAEIEGYDRDDLQPLAPGARIMVDPDSGETVAPRWTTSCGREPGQSAMAIYQTTRRVGFCDPLVDSAPNDAPPQVLVNLEDALADLACGAEPGSVARFEVRDPLTGTSAEAACDETALLAELEAGAPLELELLAYEEGQTSPTWGTLCSAQPLAGVTVEALCQPLVTDGALDLDLPAALDSVSLACDAGLRELVADPGGDAPLLRVTPPGCQHTLRVSDLPPGDATVNVSTTLSDGSAGPTLTCGGTVLPGLTTRGDCAAD
jgi:hypothetical protein